MRKLRISYTIQKLISFFLYGFVFIICLINTAKAQPQLYFKPFIQHLTNPVEIRNSGDGTGRLFIIQQGGKIIIYKNGTLLPKPFIDFSNVLKKTIFQGIWSIAFSPGFKTDNTFFLLFTNKTGTKLMRYQVSKTNPDSVILSTASLLFSIPKKGTGGPHYGDMHFGKDGYLYVTLSDGSNPKKATNLGQDAKALSGKMLRLNVTDINSSPYYSIPKDNPFINRPGERGEIWNFGFRNAWRWSFDRQTGDLWIPDVGSDKWEEVNFRKPAESAASNFGFPCYEANDTFNTAGCSGRNKYVFPIFAYPHDSSFGGQTIIGGYVYRGAAYPSLKGYYICSDFGSGNLWKIKPNGSGGWAISLQKNIPAAIVGYGESEQGELFAVSLNGTIYKIEVTNKVTTTAFVQNIP